jgi:hypothetical protein
LRGLDGILAHPSIDGIQYIVRHTGHYLTPEKEQGSAESRSGTGHHRTWTGSFLRSYCSRAFSLWDQGGLGDREDGSLRTGRCTSLTVVAQSLRDGGLAILDGDGAMRANVYAHTASGAAILVHIEHDYAAVHTRPSF